MLTVKQGLSRCDTNKSSDLKSFLQTWERFFSIGVQGMRQNWDFVAQKKEWKGNKSSKARAVPLRHKQVI